MPAQLGKRMGIPVVVIVIAARIPKRILIYSTLFGVKVPERIQIY